MKIEVGESLIGSWLTHIKSCQMVHTNWKVSPTWEKHYVNEASQILKDTLPYFNKFLSGKSKNPTLDEFLKTAECDLCGINFDNGKMNVHAVDVAFHKGGLGYTHNLEKVIEKTVRNLLCVLVYLDVTEGDIYFASPKIGPKDYNNIYNAIVNIQNIIDSYNKFNFRLHLIANEDFNSDILQSVCALTDVVADTNELWLRSIQLIEMFNNKNTVKKGKINKKLNTSKMKIGEYARNSFMSLITSGKVSDDEIKQLLDKDESKRLFNVNYPVLIDMSKNNDKSRYYSVPNRIITYKNVNYMLTREWYENRNRDLLEKWVKNH